MLCPNCGCDVGDTLDVCEKCRAAVGETNGATQDLRLEQVAPPPEASAKGDSSLPDYVGYGGFWVRWVASIFDVVVINIISSIILSLSVTFLLKTDLVGIVSPWFILPVLFISLLIPFLYFAGLESSPLQATIGKLAVGLRVTDGSGERISFLRSIGRRFGHLISVLTFGIGYLMAAFTERKRALHDIIAGTLVMRTKGGSIGRTIAVLIAAILLSWASRYFGNEGGAEVVRRLVFDAGKPAISAASKHNGGKFSAPAETNRSASALSQPALTLATVSGTIQIGEAQLQPRAVYARYNPFRSRMEIAFFRDALGSAQQPMLAGIKSLADVDGQKPLAIFLIDLNPESSSCDLLAVSSYQAVIPALDGANGKGVFMYKDGSGINSFVCQLVEGSTISGKMNSAAVTEEKTVKWDLNFSTQLVMKENPTELNFDSQSSKRVIALLNRDTDTLDIGFFDRIPSELEEENYRKAKSFATDEKNAPAVLLSLSLKKGASVLAPIQVVKYGVTFYRNESEGRDFPGQDPKATFYYIVSGEETSQVTQLGGYLREKEIVRGNFQYAANKTVGQVPFRFSWNLKFETLLIDTTIQSAGGTGGVPATPQGPYAKASVGKADLEFKTVLAFLYPQQNGLAIGFFADELTPAEIQEVKKKKVLFTHVNNKRANVIAFFDFAPGTSEIRQQNLLAYTLYFYRDKIGSFYFPGQFDEQAIKRLAVEIKPEELELISGSLRDKGTLNLRVHGSAVPKQLGERFGWDLNVSTEIFEVR